MGRKKKKAEIPVKNKKEQPRKEKQTVKIKSQDYETFFCLSKTFCFTLLHIKINAHVKKEKSKTQKNRQISILSKKYYEKKHLMYLTRINYSRQKSSIQCKISLHTSKERKN